MTHVTMLPSGTIPPWLDAWRVLSPTGRKSDAPLAAPGSHSTGSAADGGQDGSSTCGTRSNSVPPGAPGGRANVNICGSGICTAGRLRSMNAGGGAAPPAYVIRTLTALAAGVQPITRTVPLPGWAAGVGVGEGVGDAPLPGPAGGGVAVAAAGRVAVAVGVTVEVGVAVFAGVGVAVLVDVGVGVGVHVGVAVAMLVGVAVSVGVKVGVGRGSGVAARNWKFARALVPPSRQLVSMLTSMVTISPGEPVTVNVPNKSPLSVEPDPVTRLAGCEVTVMLLASHHPLPDSAPLTDGAGPDPGLSTSVASWARARGTGPGLAWFGGIDTARSAATISTLTTAGNRLIGRPPPQPVRCVPARRHPDPRPPRRPSGPPAARPLPTTRPPA